MAGAANKPGLIVPRSAILNVMVGAASKAARGLKRDFGEVENLQVSRKGPADFASAADHRAEEVIRAELMRARPDYGILMEESGEVRGRDPQHRWIVDPLDGTTNFLHGIPHFAISIALERQGRLAAGLIYNPISEELFTAERGGGAFMNDRRLRVAARTNLSEALIGTGTPFKGRGDHSRYMQELGAVLPAVAGIRRFGAAALDLAWVAAGRYDGFWERDLSAWDMAAGLLLIREAGGFVSDLDGGDGMLTNGHIAAGNESMHRQLLNLLQG
jgi:myo-inositol-1(or 4)-monophosphatase